MDEQGNPVVNMGHVLTHLNKVTAKLNIHRKIRKLTSFFFTIKLDAGSEERLMLVSRDEQSCLVVTYREIKNCVEAAFKYVDSCADLMVD